MRFAAHDDVLLMLNMGAQYCVIASKCNERGNQQARNPDTVDCFGLALTMTFMAKSC